MRLLKILIGLVAILVVAIAGLALYASRMDWNEIRPLAEERISGALGRKFEITGDLHFKWWPRLQVSADGLRLANAPWGSRPLMLEAGSVSFVIAPLSVLRGYPLSRSITMDGVDLLLEENSEGQVNWNLGDGESGGSEENLAFTELRSIVADDVTVTYLRPGSDPLKFRVDSARLGARAVGTGLALDVRGDLNEEAFTVTGDLKPVSDWFASEGLQGTVTAATSGLKVTVDGKLGRLPTLAGSDFSLSGAGSAVPPLPALSALPEDMRGQWQADLKFAGTPEQFRISDADVRLSDYRFQGDLARDAAGVYSGDVQIGAPDYQLKLGGRFGSLGGVENVDADVSGKGSRLPAVEILADLDEYIEDQWQADFHVTGTHRKVELKGLRLTVDESDVSGSLSLDWAGTRPRLAGSLDSRFLDLAILRAPPGQQAAPEPAGKGATGPVFSDAALPLDWIREADALVEVQAKQLKASVLTYQDALARISLDNGRLEIASERGQIYGAQATARLVIDASATPAKMSMQSRAQGADVGGITSRWSDPPFMTGKGDYDLDVTGQGDSLGAIMATLNGSLRIVVGEGRAEVGVLDRMVRTVGLKTIGSLLGEEKGDTVAMNCFAANLSAESGTVKADVLVMDTKHATIFGSGKLDLGKETFDLVFNPKPRSVTLNTAVPVRLGGTFRDPTITAEKLGALRKIAGIASLFVFPPAAIAALADFGAGDNQCVKLAAGSK